MRTSSLLKQHVETGKVTLGINHAMLDFKQGRSKKLDLVIARPASGSDSRSTSLSKLAVSVGAKLTEEERAEFESLPAVLQQPVGSVLVALEAKACMTAHGKAEPRLYDELNSSQQTVHGANDAAIACGLAMINIAETFISPSKQHPGMPTSVSKHKQPQVTESVINKVRQLPRRTQPGSTGFDALGIMVVNLRNDGSTVDLFEKPPAPQPGDGDTYSEMVTRAASLYDFRFSMI